VRQVYQRCPVKFGGVGGGPIDQEKHLEAAHKSRSGGCLTAQVRHHAADYHLAHTSLVEHFLQRRLVKSIVLAFPDHRPLGWL
jgi:hypothetical protein